LGHSVYTANTKQVFNLDANVAARFSDELWKCHDSGMGILAHMNLQSCRNIDKHSALKTLLIPVQMFFLQNDLANIIALRQYAIGLDKSMKMVTN